MKVWGIGATWDGKSMLNEFESKNAVAIGWSESDAPALYAMMNEIRDGDIIYIKSFVIRGKRLKIKAIGEVVATAFEKPELFGANHKTIKVKWIANSSNTNKLELDIPLSKKDTRYNVYSQTLYSEYNPDIIRKVRDYIK